MSMLATHARKWQSSLCVRNSFFFLLVSIETGCLCLTTRDFSKNLNDLSNKTGYELFKGLHNDKTLGSP